MVTIDDRVVQLKFDNKQFESATATSMSTLDKLKKSLDFSTSKKGVDTLAGSMNRFNVGNLGATIEGINGKLLAMGTIGVTALANITTKAMETGFMLAKSLTIDPITQGFGEYETNLNAIQTILSNTQAAGGNLKTVNAALAELNRYSDQTIYNFSEMARNIGTFTAAGVDLKASTAAIKGIANLAALSGSNSQQASTAMYQLSQALAAGKVTLMDWNSVVNAGMGGAVFQRALAQTAVKMGTLKDGAVALKGPMKNVTIAGLSFRESISDPKVGGWLTSGVLTKTLAQFTGDLTNAQLAAQGFSDTEIKAIQAQARAAKEAATQVKTLPQLLDVTKEAIGSGWAETWSIVFGDFAEAKGTFTALSNAINGVVTNMSEARNALLKGWKALGGRTIAIQALQNAFKALQSWLKPIADAWKEVFPPGTAKDLYNLTVTVRNFFGALILGPSTMEKIKNVFKGFFSVLDIGKQIVSGVFGFIKGLFGLFSSGGSAAAGGLLSVASNVGLMVTNFAAFLRDSGAITNFFNNLLDFLKPAAEWLKRVADNVQSAFSGLGQGAGEASAGLSPLQTILEKLKEVWDTFVNGLKNGVSFFQSVGQMIKDMFSTIGDTGGTIFQRISEAFSNINWVTLFKVGVGAGFLALAGTVIKAIWDAIDLFLNRPAKLLNAVKDMVKSVTDVMGQLKSTLKTYQNQLRFKSLLLIAGSILALAVAIKLLSTIEPGALARSVVAMGIMFAELMGTMKMLNKMQGTIVKASASMILMATAMNIMALAVLMFGNMDPATIAQGLLTIMVTLAGLAGAMQLMPANAQMAKNGAAIVLMALAVNMLAAAVLAFGNMDPMTIVQGMATIIIAIAGIGGAMNALPKSGQMVKAAAGLFIIAAALNLLIIPIKVLGSMDAGSLAQGLIGLFAALGIVTVAMIGLSVPGVFAGAAALLLVSGALLVLSGVIAVLGNMSIQQIAIGIGALVAVMVAVALAAVGLSFATPFIFGFGAALTVLGAGLALVGLGALAFATAFSIIISLMSIGFPIVKDAIENFIKLIPLMAQAFGLMLVEGAKAFIGAIPQIADAIGQMIEAMLQVLIDLMPKFGETFLTFLETINDIVIKFTPQLEKTGEVLIQAFLDTIVFMIPAVNTAALKLVNGLLKGLAENLPEIIKNGTKVITEWIKGMGKASADIAIAAGQALLDFMAAITKWINENKQLIQETTKDLGKAIVEGIVAGIVGMVSGPLEAIGGLVSSVIQRARDLLESKSPSKVFERIGRDVVQGFVNGIVAGKEDTVNATNAIAGNIKAAIDDAKRNVEDLKKKIKDLSGKPMTAANKKALAAAKAALATAVSEQRKLEAAYKTITVEHRAQIKELRNLAGQYDVIKGKLEEAQKVLDDAIKKRDDYANRISDKFGALPTMDANSSLDDYFDAIRAATQANIKFKATLEQLRNLGLDDNQYKKFMEQGTEIQPFLDALLASGGDTIKELNNIDMSLTDSATSLGKSASEALYQAGVDSAQGLVDGLTAQMTVITDKMKAIGKAIADEIKRELGIRSPSKVFSDIGKNTMLGLVKGMEASSNVVDMTVRRAGQRAAEGLTEALRGISASAIDDINLNPRIAPVIDLTDFRKGAIEIDETLGKKLTINADVSANNAGQIQAAVDLNSKLIDQIAQQRQPAVEFTQNITSPKAISAGDVYRQTKNQLSVLKGGTPIAQSG